MANQPNIMIGLLTESKDALKGINDFAKNASKELSTIEKAANKLNLAFAAVVGGFSVGAIVSGLNKAVDAALESEDAVKKLNLALKQTGIFSKKTSEDLLSFANALERTTLFTDEQVLETAALLQQMGKFTKEGLKNATLAAIELATALDKDLNTTAQAVAKASNGQVRALKSLGIEFKAGRNDAETFSNMLKAVQEKQGGAEAATNSFGGALKLIKKEYSNIFENIGNFIVKNNELKEILITVGNILRKFAQDIEDTSTIIGGSLNIAIKTLSFILNNLIPIIFSLAGALLALNFSTIAGGLSSLISLFSSLSLIIPTTSFQVLALAGSMQTLFLTVGPVLGLVAGFALIGNSIKNFIELKNAVGSLSNAFIALKTNLAINIEEFLFQPFVKLTKGIVTLIELLPGVGKSAALKNLQDSLDGSKKRVDNLYLSFGKLLEQQDRLKSEEITKKIRFDLEARLKNVQVDDEVIASQFEEIANTVKNGAKNQVDILKDNYKNQLNIVNSAIKNNIVSEEQGLKVRTNLISFYNKKILEEEIKLRNENTKNIIDSYKKRNDELKQIASDGFGFVLKKLFTNFDEETGIIKPFLKISEEAQKTVAASIGIATSITKGAKGAKDLIVQGGALALKSFAGIPPEVSGPLLDALSQGPEAVRASVQEFVTSIPVILENIILALPVLIEELLTGILLRLDDIAIGLVQALIRAVPELVKFFIFEFPKVIIQMVIELVKAVPIIVGEFIKYLIDGAGEFVNALVDFVKGLVGGGKSGGAADKIGVGGIPIIGGLVDAIGGFFGFADGGLVPGGAPFTDRVPAMLTPGERVLDRGTTEKLDQLLSQGGTAGGAQTITVNLVVGEQQLANVLLNLNRRGFRVA